MKRYAVLLAAISISVSQLSFAGIDLAGPIGPRPGPVGPGPIPGPIPGPVPGPIEPGPIPGPIEPGPFPGPIPGPIDPDPGPVDPTPVVLSSPYWTSNDGVYAFCVESDNFGSIYNLSDDYCSAPSYQWASPYGNTGCYLVTPEGWVVQDQSAQQDDQYCPNF